MSVLRVNWMGITRDRANFLVERLETRVHLLVDPLKECIISRKRFRIRLENTTDTSHFMDCTLEIRMQFQPHHTVNHSTQPGSFEDMRVGQQEGRKCLL